MVVKEEAEAEAEVKAKENDKVVETMNDVEYMAVSIYGRIVQATEMAPVTMVAVEEIKAETVVVETENTINNNHTMYNSIKIYLCLHFMYKAIYHFLRWH